MSETCPKCDGEVAYQRLLSNGEPLETMLLVRCQRCHWRGIITSDPRDAWLFADKSQPHESGGES